MQTLFVISDLHLGGSPATGDRPAFQICTAAGQARLAAFIDFVGRQPSQGDVRLVINGDFIDFLAEEPFSSFTASEQEANQKLRQVMDQHAPAVFDRLAAYVGGGGALTLLLGNHDLELSLPGPRRALLSRLGPGRVDFLYDNQAFAVGPVLIEHGNRYDGWNIVDHDGLRRVRSALSRGEAPPAFAAPAGSELVVQVMNEIKKDYPFIDLLMPENEAALPLLAVLAPEQIDRITRLTKLYGNLRIYLRSRKAAFDADGVPRDLRQIAGPDEDAAADVVAIRATAEALAVARKLAGLPDENTRSFGLADGVRGGLDEGLRRLPGLAEVLLGKRSDQLIEKVKHLQVALIHLARQNPDALRTDCEDETYLRPARASARRGYRLIVYGHTHLLKDVALSGDGVPPGARYLNTGTWADLVALPDEVLQPGDAGFQALYELVERLKEDRLDGLRGQVPSYARIDIDDGDAVDAGLFLFRGPDRQERVGKSSLQALVAPPPSAG